MDFPHMRLITTLTRKTKFVQQQQQTLLPKLRLQRHQKSAHQSRHENGPFLHTHPNFEGSIGVIFMGLLFFFFSHSTAKKNTCKAFACVGIALHS
jgi:hypothetical protein